MLTPRAAGQVGLEITPAHTSQRVQLAFSPPAQKWLHEWVTTLKHQSSPTPHPRKPWLSAGVLLIPCRDPPAVGVEPAEVTASVSWSCGAQQGWVCRKRIQTPSSESPGAGTATLRLPDHRRPGWSRCQGVALTWSPCLWLAFLTVSWASCHPGCGGRRSRGRSDREGGLSQSQATPGPLQAPPSGTEVLRRGLDGLTAKPSPRLWPPLKPCLLSSRHSSSKLPPLAHLICLPCPWGMVTFDPGGAPLRLDRPEGAVVHCRASEWKRHAQPHLHTLKTHSLALGSVVCTACLQGPAGLEPSPSRALPGDRSSCSSLSCHVATGHPGVQPSCPEATCRRPG
nr:uncharacterized protein LOC129023205 isoform X1 [Pongo pygmaeus]XP_054325725.1 uncharacterized protein LOC129023205 isoform X1 [Pongo pygmaeus]XP_054325726.1 uncharacterized protein LOC129023205 isoform X1 [Pongo pygmaeus]